MALVLSAVGDQACNEGSPCTLNSDCGEGYYCVSGVCTEVQCREDRDCPSGQACGPGGLCQGGDGSLPDDRRDGGVQLDGAQGDGPPVVKWDVTPPQWDFAVRFDAPLRLDVNGQQDGPPGVKFDIPLSGDECVVACDCDQGESCIDGFCALMGEPSYCCNKAGCPAGEMCTYLDGAQGVCAATMLCSSTCECAEGLSCEGGTCDYVAGALPCCDWLRCPEGSSCLFADGTMGTCAECHTACDCPQGQGCLGGNCSDGASIRYCCTNPGCETGQTCEFSTGLTDTCAEGECSSHCDCPQGQACCEGGDCDLMRCYEVDPGHHCNRGVCVPTDPPTFCCDNPGCPEFWEEERAVCYTKDYGSFYVCPGGSFLCVSHCDCAEGQVCRDGHCQEWGTEGYCCEEPSRCPTGEYCQHRADGSPDHCP